MAEQTIDRPRQVSPSPAVLNGTRPAAPLRMEAAEALRQARTCLETSDKHLRRGDAKGADEILSLLQNATSFLESALFPVSYEAQGAE